MEQSFNGPKCYAILHVHGIPIELHEFELANTNTAEFHRQLMSFNSFCNREQQRQRDSLSHRLGRTSYVCHCVARIQDASYESDKAAGLFDHLPVVTHSDIWSFYKAIEYDLERKLYVRDGECQKEPSK